MSSEDYSLQYKYNTLQYNDYLPASYLQYAKYGEAMNQERYAGDRVMTYMRYGASYATYYTPQEKNESEYQNYGIAYKNQTKYAEG